MLAFGLESKLLLVGGGCVHVCMCVVSSLNRQLWTVINFVLTVVCSFVFGYFAAYFADMSTTTVRALYIINIVYLFVCLQCVFVGLLIGGVVFLADLYFLLRSPGVSEPYQHQNRNK